MVTVAALLQALREAGVVARAEDGRLVTRGRVPDYLRPLVKENRSALVNLLSREALRFPACPLCAQPRW